MDPRRLVGERGESDGSGGEVHHDSLVQERLLPGNHRRREEGLGHSEQDTVSPPARTPAGP